MGLGNNLSGSIPSKFGFLTELDKLRLYGNDLNGFIPNELGALSNLRHLCLYNNSLDGFIPNELGALDKLRLLHSLNRNSLMGLDMYLVELGLGNLTNLKYLVIR